MAKKNPNTNTKPSLSQHSKLSKRSLLAACYSSAHYSVAFCSAT
jgi:hypothetical protein